ncbi:MAG: ABC transporter ATP-binding protein/permease [Schleiferilactobacillus harbinensis]|jgi:ATP-binding cassette subfamily C protein|nr:ABC transporter ATP-binding protein/permease [Schleiferilactobacillus harbinensis]MCI1912817.1 ABC transporter ATP-binding protein/permease [Schleiferilactobacillus harbinensis]
MKKLISQFKFKISIIAILIALGTVLETGSSLVTAFAINRMISRQISQFFQFMILAALLSFAASGFAYFGRVLFVVVSQNMTHTIRKQYVRQLVSNYKPFSSVSSSDSVNTLTNDMQLLFQNTFTGYLGIFASCCNILFASIALISFNWMLLMATAVLAAIMILLPRIFKHKLSEATRAISTRNTGFISEATNWINGLTDLFWSKTINKVWPQIRQSSTDLENAYIHQAKVSQKVSLVESIMNMASQFILVVFGGILAIYRIITFGAAMSTGNLAFQAFNALLTMSDRLSLAMSGHAIVQEVDHIMNDEKQTDDQPTSADVIIKGTVDTIEAKNLSYRFSNSSKQLEFPDFHISRGEKVAVVGPSGGGKTTLLKLISGRLRNYNGLLRINDIDQQQIDFSNVTDYMDFMPQKPTVFRATLLENIELFQEGSREQLQTAIQKANIASLIEKTPEGSLDSPAESISGGEAQRIALARIFYHNRKLVLVDEGTSSLDPQNAQLVVKSLTSDPELTVIFVTHTTDSGLLNQFDQIVRLTGTQE